MTEINYKLIADGLEEMFKSQISKLEHALNSEYNVSDIDHIVEEYYLLRQTAGIFVKDRTLIKRYNLLMKKYEVNLSKVGIELNLK